MKIMIFLVFLLLLTTLLTTAGTTSTTICGSFFLVPGVAAISMFIRKQDEKATQRTNQRHDDQEVLEHNIPSIVTIPEHEVGREEQAVVLLQEEEQQEAEFSDIARENCFTVNL